MSFRADIKALSAELVEVFGEAAVLTDETGSSNIKVVFDERFESVGFDIGEVASRYSAAKVKTVDVAHAKHDDTLVVDGVTYTIIGIQPDGLGITLLTLSGI
ncbi:MAG: hypothetical protein A3J24_06440 [Deltaproteobacteria bacterium RIFCSPLOWO2_02_FULL_53_8]|nr:MAG: hypothetical protein A3J24_06440 [Deltaproteobacteria bacterium RIFCSPLOWO2_02_FULL_53_8]